MHASPMHRIIAPPKNTPITHSAACHTKPRRPIEAKKGKRNLIE